MIRPVGFRMNEQTVVNNFFQEDLDIKNAEINAKAQQEFDDFVDKLRAVGGNIIVINDDLKNDSPDSIFPNNWVSFHRKGNLVLYPNFAEDRGRQTVEETLKRI